MSEQRFPLASAAQAGAELRRQIKTVPGARKQWWLAIALLSLGAAANVFIPLLLGQVVDVVVQTRPLSDLLWLGAALLLCAAAAAVLAAVGFYLLARISERVIANLRVTMVSTALGLPVHTVEEAGTGDLVSRSTDDVAELSSAVTETVPILASSVFMVGATTVALFALDWQFLLVPLLVIPVYYFAARQYLRKAPSRYAAERAAMAERARRVLEAIHGRASVRAYRLEAQMHARIGDASREVVRSGMRARTTMLVMQVWITISEFLMLACALLVGFHLVASGSMTVGSVTAAALMLIRLRGPLMWMMRVLDTVQSGYASLSRIVGVVIDPPIPVPESGAPAPRGEVELRGVGFAYERSGWAVRGIDIRIQPGRTVALVGASGAGKTTVAALLAGLRVPQEGSVLIDGVEVTQLSDSERVARLAMISQEVHVFSGTLREDLALAAPGASEEEMRDALAAVGADWFEQLADGLDTEVGAMGLQLDPLAAQQLALARILLLDPAVVVMDEATAEAGSAGAGTLERAAAAVLAGRSALIVAHRLDQAASADEILVMAEGEIIERGRQADLVALGGTYTKLWESWSKGREH